LAEHPQAASHDQQNARQDHENTAAAATHPRAAWALWLEKTAAAQQAAWSHTHSINLLLFKISGN
jgi:hypothetical protein